MIPLLSTFVTRDDSTELDIIFRYLLWNAVHVTVLPLSMRIVQPIDYAFKFRRQPFIPY
jgi:hypothetical protein